MKKNLNTRGLDMKNLFKALVTVTAAGVAVVAGKLCYDFFVKKNGQDYEDDFFDDFEDDFSGVVYDDDFFKFEPESEEAVKTEPAKEDEVSTAKPETKETKPKETKPKAKKKELKKAQSLTCLDVIDCTSDVLGVSTEDILSKSRKADVANARRVAIYICATELKVTNAVICEEFGGIGATSVTNAKKSIGDKIKEDAELKADVEDIVDGLKRLEDSFNKK